MRGFFHQKDPGGLRGLSDLFRSALPTLSKDYFIVSRIGVYDNEIIFWFGSTKEI